ncbi:MAG: ribonuclease P protein component [Candidatus Paceibacterota bacterium]
MRVELVSNPRMLAKRYRLSAAFFKKIPLSPLPKRENDFFVVRRYPSSRSYGRFAAVVSKKVAARAVVRTHIRRAVYEYVRCCHGWSRSGNDVVVVVKKKFADCARPGRAAALDQWGTDITN